MFQKFQVKIGSLEGAGKMSKLCVGVLSLQGCVQPHKAHIESLGATFKEVRRPEDFKEIQGLIIPGGESTTMLKIIDIFSLDQALQESFKRIPIWGICAGAILMARKVESPTQYSYGLLDITVERNSYGRQVDSFNSALDGYLVSFIRAPRILEVGSSVQVKALENKEPVWVKSGKNMATTFHPELNPEAPSPMHREFIKMIELSL